MASYFNACYVTLPVQTSKRFYNFLKCTCAAHFEKGSATHGHCPHRPAWLRAWVQQKPECQW